MKAVILCGGKGTRLHEETEFKPKPLVEIGGMPILWHIMKIYSHFGVKDFILCLGYKGNMIKNYFLNFEEMTHNFTLTLRDKHSRVKIHNQNGLEDWNISFVDTGIETQTGGRIARIKEYIGDDETFFLTYGDGLSNVNIQDVYEFHKERGRVLSLTGVNPPSFFGVLTAKDGIVTSFKEKPKLSGVVNGGYFVCDKKLFHYISEDESCIFEEEPMRKLTKERQLACYLHQGFWFPMDTQKHVNELNSIWHSDHAPWKVW